MSKTSKTTPAAPTPAEIDTKLEGLRAQLAPLTRASEEAAFERASGIAGSDKRWQDASADLRKIQDEIASLVAARPAAVRLEIKLQNEARDAVYKGRREACASQIRIRQAAVQKLQAALLAAETARREVLAINEKIVAASPKVINWSGTLCGREPTDTAIRVDLWRISARMKDPGFPSSLNPAPARFAEPVKGQTLTLEQEYERAGKLILAQIDGALVHEPETLIPSPAATPHAPAYVEGGRETRFERPAPAMVAVGTTPRGEPA